MKRSMSCFSLALNIYHTFPIFISVCTDIYVFYQHYFQKLMSESKIWAYESQIMICN